jgi:hypothetical protein
MKKEKSKKQELKSSIKQSLIDDIKQSVKNLGYSPKDVKDEIVKASQQLAKAIAKNKKESKLKASESEKSKSDPGQEISHAANQVTDSSLEHSSQETESGDSLPVKRIVIESNRNANIDPIALAQGVAQEKAKAGEPDLHEQLGSVS